MASLTLGHRIMCPAEGFDFTSKYAEMRRLGAYPSVLPYAALFASLELARQVPNLQAVFRHFSTQIAGNLRLEEVMFGDWEEAKVQSAVLSIEFSQAFLAFANDYFQSLGIDAESADSTSILQTIVSSLDISVVIYCIDGKEYKLSGGEGGIVALGVVQETCFLLYPQYTTESFCRLPCGHIQMKYEVMRQFQKAAGRRAVSLQDAELGAALLCPACNLCYRPELHSEFALQVIQSLNSPTSLQPPSNLTAEVWQNEYVCWVCYQTIGKDKYVSYCTCPYTVCESCFVVNYFTANWDKCPKCKSNLTYFTSETARLTEEPLLQPLLTPPNYALQPVSAKYCSSCKRLQNLEFFQTAENVNSWKCTACIEGVASTVVPLDESGLSQQVEKLKLSSDDEDSKDGQLAAESVSQVDPRYTASNMCSICSEVIEEKGLEGLENHVECKVCYKCILASSNFKKCPQCAVPYDEREKETTRLLVRKNKSLEAPICSEPLNRCSICSKMTSEAVHRCLNAQICCVSCFLCRSLDTIHGSIVNCKVCSREVEKPFLTATTQFNCSTCSKPITISDIGHACTHSRLICQQCIGAPQGKEVHCSGCGADFLNRLLLA